MKYELWTRESLNGGHMFILTTDNIDMLRQDIKDNKNVYIRVLYPNTETPFFINNFAEYEEYVEDFYERKYNYNMSIADDDLDRNSELTNYIKNNREKDDTIMLQPPTLDTTQTNAINPKHYQNVAAGRQYVELMVDMLARFEGVEAHLMGQTYKYLMRAKLKDPLVQDLKKARWYLDALIKYAEEGKVM